MLNTFLNYTAIFVKYLGHVDGSKTMLLFHVPTDTASHQRPRRRHFNSYLHLADCYRLFSELLIYPINTLLSVAVRALLLLKENCSPWNIYLSTQGGFTEINISSSVSIQLVCLTQLIQNTGIHWLNLHLTKYKYIYDYVWLYYVANQCIQDGCMHIIINSHLLCMCMNCIKSIHCLIV